MTVLINASNSSGLTITSDTSGNIAFQSQGTTIATVQPAGFSYAGGVVQVVSATLTNAASTTATIAVSSGAYTSTGASTGLTATITPKFANSKILVQGTIGGANGNPGAAQCQFLLVRGTTPIGNGTSSGNQPGLIARSYYNDTNTAIPANFSYLDSPATTNATTYTLNFGTENASYPVYINRTPER